MVWLGAAVRELIAAEVARAWELISAAAGAGEAGLGGIEELAREVGTRVGRALVEAACRIDDGEDGARTPCPGCGGAARRVGVRDRRTRTLLGEVTRSRAWYHCPTCRAGFAPADARLGVGSDSLSPGLLQVAARMGAEIPYQRAAALIAQIAGQPLVSASTLARTTRAEGTKARRVLGAEAAAIRAGRLTPEAVPPGVDTLYVVPDGTGAPMLPSETLDRAGKDAGGRAHTREVKIAAIFTQSGRDGRDGPVQDPGSTTYVATFDPAPDFAAAAQAEARRRGLGEIRQVVVISDGAKWIHKMEAEHFPAATWIVDIYHAREHLTELATTLEAYLPTGRTTWWQARYDELDNGDVDAIAAAIDAIDLPDGSTEAKTARRERAFFVTNRDRMRYPAFRAMGMFIGSGAVESACNTIVKQRSKRAGMHWTVNGLDPIIALRALDRSGRTHLIWPTTHNQTPRAA